MRPMVDAPVEAVARRDIPIEVAACDNVRPVSTNPDLIAVLNPDVHTSTTTVAALSNIDLRLVPLRGTNVTNTRLRFVILLSHIAVVALLVVVAGCQRCWSVGGGCHRKRCQQANRHDRSNYQSHVHLRKECILNNSGDGPAIIEQDQQSGGWSTGQ
jgi:hypothetical protein